MRKSKGGLELHNCIKELKMYEKNLYPAVEKFLRTQKNCLSEYVGNELSLKREIIKNMLEQQKKYHDARMDRDKELYERQIKVVDAQIDRRVYGLYGLTEEEVKVVEKSQ
jgi:predicted ATP-grasp superfamily ATP-dependent carboligase